MKRSSIHISIPAPCHESWHSMDTTPCGAYCHSCQKEVIDFSAMTDREVIEYLSKNKVGCGKFRNDQLNTNLTIPKVNNGFLKWKALFLSLLPLFSARISYASGSDQNDKPQTQQDSKAAATDDKLTISGRINDGDGKPIAAARIEVVNSSGDHLGLKTLTDSAGYFSIRVDTDLLNPRLRISKEGYQPETQSIDDRSIQEYAICLSPEEPEAKTQTVTIKNEGCTIGCIAIATTGRTEQDFNFQPIGFDFEYGHTQNSSRFGRKDY